MMAKFKDYKVSMEEIHHTQKLDKPSGTAISLADAIINHTDKNSWAIENPKEDDVFIDVKIENYLKDTYPVISTDMGEVIAVLGLKIGEKYRVQHEDSYCFRLDFIQN